MADRTSNADGIPDVPSRVLFKHAGQYRKPRSPAREADIYARAGIDDVLPCLGPVIKRMNGNYRVKKTLFRLARSRTRVDVLASGVGAGKSHAVLLLAIDRALESREKGSEWAGCVFLVPTNALAHNLYSDAVKLSRECTDGRVTCYLYLSALDESERRSLRRKPPDILFMTPDMYYRSIAGSSRGRRLDSGPGELTSWERRLVKPAMLFFDEIDNGSGYTASCLAAIFKAVLDLNTPKKSQERPFKLVLASATVPNADEVFKPLFEEPIMVINEPAVHGDIEIWVFDTWVPVTAALERSSPGDTVTKPKNHFTRWELVLDTLLHAEEYRHLRVLVYLDNRDRIELLMKRYRDNGDIVFYHAGRWNAHNQQALERFNANQARILVSTSAVESGVNIAGLDRIIIIGLPGENRKLLQRYARVSREWGKKGFIYLFLDAGKEQERVLLDDPERALELLTSPDPENLVINLDNKHVIKLALLFRTVLGLHALEAVEHHAPRKRVQRCLVELLAAGELGYHGGKLHRTAFTAGALSNVKIRQIEGSRAITLVDGTGDKQCLGFLNAVEVRRHALPGQVFVREGHYWRVKEINGHEVVVEQENTEVHGNKGKFIFLARNDIFTTVTRLEPFTVHPAYPFSLARVTLLERVTRVREIARGKGATRTDQELTGLLTPEGLSHFDCEKETEGLVFTIPFNSWLEARVFGFLFFLEVNRELLADGRDVKTRVLPGQQVNTTGDNNSRGGSVTGGSFTCLLHDRKAPAGVSRSIFYRGGELLAKTVEAINSCARHPEMAGLHLGNKRVKLEALISGRDELATSGREQRVNELFEQLNRFFTEKDIPGSPNNDRELEVER